MTGLRSPAQSYFFTPLLSFSSSPAGPDTALGERSTTPRHEPLTKRQRQPPKRRAHDETPLDGLGRPPPGVSPYLRDPERVHSEEHDREDAWHGADEDGDEGEEEEGDDYEG
jgi:hypothetical protein